LADPLIQLAAGCLLAASEAEVTPLGQGWKETVTYEVVDEGGCDGLTLVLPRDVHLRSRGATLRMSDDTKRRIDEGRWELPERGLDDEGVARLDVPEMKRRDRVVVEAVRHWDRPDYDGRAGAKGAAADLPAPIVASQAPFTAAEAWERAAAMIWLPRGADGNVPVAGDAALKRGAADDRGFAATVASLATKGSDRVEIARRGEADDPDAAVVPVWWDGDRAVLLAHPDDPSSLGPVRTSKGVVTPVPHEWTAPARAEAPPPAAQRTIALEIPDGDPQASLYPGAGSAALTTETVTFDPADAARVWWMPVPAEAADLRIEVAPQLPSTTSRQRDDGLVVVVGPSDERTTVTVSWRKPDAPTCGQVLPRAGEALEWAVQDPKGRIRTEGSWWSLTSHDGKPIMPDRASVVNGLDWRFARQSLPEPALPLELKGRALDEELIRQMRSALLKRAAIADLPGDPLWPRKLYKARRTEVLDPIEAAIVMRLYAQQVRLPATWALARPAELGPGDEICPVGYEDAVLAVEWEGQLRWVDPSCSVCGTFELRPHLDGASVYTSVASKTPEVTGKEVVRTTADGVAVGLQGPPALLLRLWLQEVPADDRPKAIAERYAGPGAELVKAEGIDVAGGAIKLLIKGAAPADPLALPAPGEDGSTWAVWAGERRAERPLVGEPGEPVDLDLGAIRYQRKVEDGRLVEILEVKDRRISSEARGQLEAAR
jgi:hypothetical protein